MGPRASTTSSAPGTVSLRANSEFRNIDTSAVRPDLPTEGYRRNTHAVLSDTITLSPTFVVTGRFGLTRLMWDSVGAANFTIAKAAGTLDTWPKTQGLGDHPPHSIPPLAGSAHGGSLFGPQF